MNKTIDNRLNLNIGDESVVNNIITPLDALETYTGIWEKNAYPDVGVSCLMDTPGILYFDFSNDGISVNTFPTSGFSIEANIHEFHIAVKLSRFFRIRVVNTGGAQVLCKVFVYYGTFRQPNQPLGSTINDDSDSIIVRNPYDDIDIARGNVQSVTKFTKFGEATISNVLKVISTNLDYQTPTTAQNVEILSSDARDTNGGLGAHSVIVVGLNSNWEEQTETVNLNGVTPVSLNAQFTRVYRMIVNVSGTYANSSQGSHFGTITLRSAGGGVTWGVIPLLHGFSTGQSLIGAYTVPVGKILYLQSLTLSSNTSKTVSVIFFKRENVSDVISPYSPMRVIRTFDGIDNVITVPLNGIDNFSAGTDVGLMALTSAGSADVTVQFSGYLINV